MNRSLARRVSTILLILGASFVALTAAATISAQGPAQKPESAPVRKELDEFRENALKKTSPERLRA